MRLGPGPARGTSVLLYILSRSTLAPRLLFLSDMTCGFRPLLKLKVQMPAYVIVTTRRRMVIMAKVVRLLRAGR